MKCEISDRILTFLFHREYGLRKQSSLKSNQTSLQLKQSINSNCSHGKISQKSNNTFGELENQMHMLLEYKAASKGVIEKTCDLKNHPKSTFIIAFSGDGRRMASLHGDHTIRITDIATGRNHQTLRGHPRSPWTAEFHKTHRDILASGCLAGQVRIWDLSSGECDTWQSPTQNTIASLALHPTAKILVIAESRNIYIWNWEFFSEPQLFASSRKGYETVRWVKFNYDGDMFYTGRTASAEHDSWEILRQVPSVFEINQQRIRSQTALRARNHYQASLNAEVSLGEMLGNPLEISNDLLVQRGQVDDCSMDVYHVATTYAQLHRIHTGDNDTTEAASRNLSTSNHLSSGRAPHAPQTLTSREEVEGTQTWSPPRQGTTLLQQITSAQDFVDAPIPDILETGQPLFHQNSEAQSVSGAFRHTQNTNSGTESRRVCNSTNSNEILSNTNSRANPAHEISVSDSSSGSAGTTASSQTSRTNSSTSRLGEGSVSSCAGSGITQAPLSTQSDTRDTDAITRRLISTQSNTRSTDSITQRLVSTQSNTQDDSIFGVSLNSRLRAAEPVNISTTRASNLAVSRPQIRRLNTTVVNLFEPDQPLEIAQVGESARTTEQGKWTEVLKLLGRLDGPRGRRVRMPSGSLSNMISRLEALPEAALPGEVHAGDLSRHRLLRQMTASLRRCVHRADHPSNNLEPQLQSRLTIAYERLNNFCTRLGTLSNSAESDATNTDITNTSAGSLDAHNIPLSDVDAASTSQQHSNTFHANPADVSTDTEPRSTRSFGVSTEDLGSTGERSRRARHRRQPDANVGRISSPFEDRDERPDRSDSPDPIHHRQHSLRFRHDPVQISRPPQQIQRWCLDEQVTDLNKTDNIIIRRCKIHNDAGIDISQDGTILALFVVNPNTARCPGIHQGMLPDTMLRLISLREDTLGAVLHQLALVANPVSLSISPLNGYILVGLAGWRNNTDQPRINFDIYRIPTETGLYLKMCRSVFSVREDTPMAIVNCVRWLPMSGQGIVIGTNQGSVIINHNTSVNSVNLSMNSSDLYLPDLYPPGQGRRGLFLN